MCNNLNAGSFLLDNINTAPIVALVAVFGYRENMLIRLVLTKNALRAWHIVLINAIKAQGYRVTIRWATHTAPQRTGIASLLLLEDTLYGPRKAALTSPVQPHALPAQSSTDEQPDISICLMPDKAGDNAEGSGKNWHLSFDGAADENMLWDALLDGRAPELLLTDSDGQTHGFALPAVEIPQRIGAAADDVLARVISMIVAAISGSTTALRTPSAQPVPKVRRRSPLQFFAASLVAKINRRLNKLTAGTAQWHVAYRPLDHHGQRVIQMQQWSQSAYTTVPDDRQRYYADPFPVACQGRQFLFMEEFPYATSKGILSVTEIKSDGRCQQPRPCLEAETHLSYPQVFQHNDVFYIIPESCAANRIDLYRCREFPWHWEFEATLVADTPASDCTVFRHDNRWWMLGTVAEFGGSTWDCLHAWHADNLTGPWHAHSKNPLLIDSSCARPAGTVVQLGSKLLRPVQNCTGGYGAGLGIAEITQLTETDFQQAVLAQLAPDPRWRASGAHTLNDNGVIEAIDYFA